MATIAKLSGCDGPFVDLSFLLGRVKVKCWIVQCRKILMSEFSLQSNDLEEYKTEGDVCSVSLL